MTDENLRTYAALDDVERIVQRAVRDAVEPIEKRLADAEKKLQNTVSTEVAQKMIDSSVVGISDRVREVHSLFKAVDITMRNAETTISRFGEKVVGTNALLDKLERRINEIDNRVDDIEAAERSLRLALYGDSSRKDAPPSMYGMVQAMPEEMSRRLKMELTPLQNQMQEMAAVQAAHTTFIEKRRKIEQTVIGTVRGAIKSPIVLKLFWFTVAGGGIGAAAAVLLQLLGQ